MEYVLINKQMMTDVNFPLKEKNIFETNLCKKCYKPGELVRKKKYRFSPLQNAFKVFHICSNKKGCCIPSNLRHTLK